MFKRIMLPVDLAHVDKLGHALKVAADLATHYGAGLTFVGVTGTAPGSVAHTPQEFSQKLAEFATAQGREHGCDTASHMVVSNDPAVGLDAALIKGLAEVGADLVVMATHLPNMADMILPNHGGALARHSDVSVFLVRHA